MYRLAAVIPLVALLAGCTVAGGERYDRPTAPDDLVLRVEIVGGLVAPSARLTELPMFSLYGDGRVIRPGPQIAIYPAPLLPNLQQFTMSPAEVESLLARAEAAGLLGPDADYPVAGIADAGTTVFTTNVNGHHRITAYALMEGGTEHADPSIQPARAKLLAFLSDLPEARSTAYSPSQVRLLVGRHDPATDDYATGGIPRGTMDWPVRSVDLATAGTPAPGPVGWRCFTVAGDDASAFLDAARRANALTLWRQDGVLYTLVARPLLPDESGCPAAGTA
jgi:hypothetical protein